MKFRRTFRRLQLNVRMKTVNAVLMCNQQSTSTLLVVFKIMIPCLLFLLVWTLNDGRRQSNASALPGRGETSGILERPSNQRPKANRLEEAVCTGDLLDERHHHYEKETDGNYRFTTDQRRPCRLLRYTTDRIVSCFDSLHDAKRGAGNMSQRSNGSLHFMFIGDSRIRQQFYNFAKLIPDYDQIRQPIRNSPSFHDEMEITSNILKLRLSYKWQHLIDDSVTDTIRRWATYPDPTERPHLLLLSMVVHHMLGTNGADHRLYQTKLKKFAPELARLANVTRVIWLNQYPVVEFHGKIYAHNTYIYSEKIENYNKAIRRVLENENSGIRIWDSSGPLAEEYIRSCAVLKRDEIVDADSRPYLFKNTAFADCNDYIHTGYLALSQATNLLYNDICNNVMKFD